MQTFLFYLKKILLAKWCFQLPKEKKLLLYDREGDVIMSLFFYREDYEIIDVRFEKIYISILILALILN